MLSISGVPDQTQAYHRLHRNAPSPIRTIPRYVGKFVSVATDKHSGSTSRFRSGILEYRFVEPNTWACLWVTPIDIDRPDALSEVLFAVSAGHVPIPSWVTHNADTGHAQVGYIIEHVYPSGAKGDFAPKRLYIDLWSALTATLGGDWHFSRHRMRNPWHASADTRWGITAPRSMTTLMRELRDSVDGTPPLLPSEAHKVALAPTASIDSRPLVAGERNSGVFDVARLAAYQLARQGAVSVEMIARVAASVPCNPPLDVSEVHGIARSINAFVTGRYTGQGGGRQGPSPEYSALQAARGRRGGLRRTESQSAALNSGRARGSEASRVARATTKHKRDAAIISLAEDQPELTRLQIQERLGESRTRVQRVISEHSRALAASSAAARSRHGDTSAAASISQARADRVLGERAEVDATSGDPEDRTAMVLSGLHASSGQTNRAPKAA